jgi:KRAB domain-containing zinc finger protein
MSGDIVANVCLFCNCVFLSVSGIRRHLVKKHRIKLPHFAAREESKKAILIADKCATQSVDGQMTENQPINQSINQNINQNICYTCGAACSSTSSENVTKQDICNLCSQMISCEKLPDNPEAADIEKPYACKICHWKFTTSQFLKIHLRRHTNYRPHICNKCGKTFTTRNSAQSHLYGHGSKRFQCAVCPKQFYFESTLNTHMTTHTGEKPFGCTLCSKRFSAKHDVKVHMRSHTGQRPYVCEFCGNSYKMSCHLKKHRYNHTGERPEKCPECYKGLKSKAALRKHMKSHVRNSRLMGLDSL